jgi:hypothetical protein
MFNSSQFVAVSFHGNPNPHFDPRPVVLDGNSVLYSGWDCVVSRRRVCFRRSLNTGTGGLDSILAGAGVEILESS